MLRVPEGSPVLRSHTSSPPCGAAGQLPLAASLLIQRHEEPEWPGESLSFPLSGIVVVSPAGCILPFGTKTSRLEDHKVTGTGSKNLVSGPPGVMMSGATLISVP